MPARRDWTADELAARLVREREQARVRMARWRARNRERVTATVTVTTFEERGGVTVTPPLSQTLSPPGLSTTSRLLERLAPFASRAFAPDPAFLALLAERYPAVDLELELAAALDWLEEPRHAKRRCSKGFLANWVKKADADRTAREQQALQQPPAAPPTWRHAVLPNGHYVQPQALQHNRQPDRAPLLNGPLERIDPAAAHRVMAQAARVPLKDRLAQARGGTR